ncbi:MAG TPA: hypothetical protein VHO70_21540 [Chitinispirillaceae bacterium]|nr:hypothetical protein [Chitinispirillaceae bacterium]
MIQNLKHSFISILVLTSCSLVYSQRQMESLDRGLVAVSTGGNNVFFKLASAG